MADFNFYEVTKEAQEKAMVDYYEKDQQFKICEKYPGIKITIAYSLFHMALRDSLLGLKLYDFYEFIQNFDGERYLDETTAEIIKNEIEDIFQPDIWRLQGFSLNHAFLSIFMAFEAYLLKMASGMTRDFIRSTDEKTVVFLDYIFVRKFEIKGYFDYFNKIFNLNIIQGDFEGKKNNTQWLKLDDFIKVRNSIIHRDGIKNVSDQIDMVKRTGESNNKPPKRNKISKNDIEDLTELIIYFTDQIE